MKVRAEARERYEEIELELKELRRYASTMKTGAWGLMAFGWVVNAVILAGVAVLVPEWLMVVAPAFVGAQVLVGWWDTQARIQRLQSHNLTLHDELLRTQELLVRYVVPEDRQAAAEQVVPQALK